MHTDAVRLDCCWANRGPTHVLQQLAIDGTLPDSQLVTWSAEKSPDANAELRPLCFMLCIMSRVIHYSVEW